MTQSNDLATHNATPLAGHDAPMMELNDANPIAAMLAAIIKSNMTPGTAEVAQTITDLYIKMEDRAAKKAFERDMKSLFAELPEVGTNREIPGEDKRTGKAVVRSRFADYKQVMRALRPLLVKYGFTISYSSKYESDANGNRITACCNVTHGEGHTKVNEFTVRTSSPPGSSITQSDGGSQTFAKRYALYDAFNIVVNADNDARLEGTSISAEQAADLEQRLAATGSNPAAFLKVAGAESFAAIRVAYLPVLLELLTQKEEAIAQRNAKATTATTATTPPAAGRRKDWTEWISEQHAEWGLLGQDGKVFADTVNGFVVAKAKKTKENSLTDADRMELKRLLASKMVQK